MESEVFPLAVGPVTITRVFKSDVLVGLFGCETGYLDDDLSSFFHRGNGHELIASVEVQSACEDVGAGKAFK